MKHAAIIPLAGGAVIGAAQATGNDPEYLASWSAFAKNDSYARKYYPNVPYHNIDDGFKRLPKVDIITCVPPCSGLSTATASHRRGCNAPANEHMLNVAEFGMGQKTPVIIIENAPTLFSPGGEKFAERFVPLIQHYGYSMQLLKTSTILHGLPQNRVRSFVILYRGNSLPEFDFIRKKYKPLNEYKVHSDSNRNSRWEPKEDEMLQVLVHFLGVKNYRGILNFKDNNFGDGPMTAWKLLNKIGKQHSWKFKNKIYKYMVDHSYAGDGIMDRSPYLVTDHVNALMWKSAEKLLNPQSIGRGMTMRELMDLMGKPRDYEEIPVNHANVLFQNVPVTTAKTLIEEVMAALDGKRTWKKPGKTITRIDNIKQMYV